MFKPRNIDQIQREFNTYLLQQNSQLTDVGQGSLLYTLSRAFAATQLKSDLALNNLTQSFYLDTVVGPDLDLRAADYALTRKPGARAEGYALAISKTEAFNLQGGVILTDPVTTLQFEVNTTGLIGVSSFSEVRVPIICTVTGELGNLEAGTKLISPTYPQASFVVGTHRTSAGNLCGDLSKGLNTETDEELRYRIQQVALYARSTSESALKTALLAENSVPWVALKYPKPGIIQVWVDNASLLPPEELLRLKVITESLKAAGIPLVTVHQANRVYAPINVQVLPTTDVNLQLLTKQMVGYINNYLLQLGLGESLIRNDLLARVSNLPGIVSASILEPLTDTTAGEFEVVRSNKIWITYETR